MLTSAGRPQHVDKLNHRPCLNSRTLPARRGHHTAHALWQHTSCIADIAPFVDVDVERDVVLPLKRNSHYLRPRPRLQRVVLREDRIAHRVDLPLEASGVGVVEEVAAALRQVLAQLRQREQFAILRLNADPAFGASRAVKHLLQRGGLLCVRPCLYWRPRSASQVLWG